MYYRAFSLGEVRLWVFGTVLATIALALVLLIQSAPSAQAEDGGPPLGDCFGGALSSEPLHCYLLEQAQKAGEINIDAIYEVANGVFAYLRQEDNIDSFVERPV